MLASLWPWLLVAAAGALHGLNPVGGWGLAVASGLRSGERWQALRALGPIALGHLLSVGLVAGAAVLGLSAGGQGTALCVAGLALLALVAGRLHRRRAAPRATGLALGSFVVSSLHGAGLALVPALVPLCRVNEVGSAGAASGLRFEALWLALAAFGLHTAAMLLVSGAVALVICRAAALVRRAPPPRGALQRESVT